MREPASDRARTKRSAPPRVVAPPNEIAPPPADWWVYVLTSKVGLLRTYVGATTDPARRLRQHNGLEPGGGSHTRAHRPWRLGVVFGPFESRSAAQRTEWEVKRLPGQKRLKWARGGRPRRLLLLSNSTNFGSGYLDHAMPEILDFLGGARRLLFVPFALADRTAYTAKARERFARERVAVTGLREGAAGARQIERAEAVFVGGGNTFRLLATLERARLLAPLARRARAGLPYLGASAGTNIAAPSIKTTNDMPIVEPSRFDALALVPFQINPHYLDPDSSSRHMGESREQRLREFHEENDLSVVGLREGAWLRVEGERVSLGGAAGARVFRRGREPEEFAPGAALDDLLAPAARGAARKTKDSARYATGAARRTTSTAPPTPPRRPHARVI